MPVKLSEIVDTLDLLPEDGAAYLNRKTGEVVMIMGEDLMAAESERSLEGYPEWQIEVIETAREILEDEEDIYVPLPSQFDVDEYRIMERFCRSVEDVRVGDELSVKRSWAGAPSAGSRTRSTGSRLPMSGTRARYGRWRRSRPTGAR